MSYKESDNFFSNWFPKVENCGIKVPKSIIIPIEDKEFFEHMYMEHVEQDLEYYLNFAKTVVMPKIEEAGLGLLFLKNSVFSNKFDARTCMPVDDYVAVAQAIAGINYGALCVDSGGEQEIIVRQRIWTDSSKIPTIYNGLPLQPEFRVFYDFDAKKVLYSVNYWDYDYVYPHLYDATDKIVFASQKEKLEHIFSERREEVEKLISDHMPNVEGLSGQWSVDILLDCEGTFWLIDMAVAQRSAYWHEVEDARKAEEEKYKTFELSAEDIITENK